MLFRSWLEAYEPEPTAPDEPEEPEPEPHNIVILPFEIVDVYVNVEPFAFADDTVTVTVFFDPVLVESVTVTVEDINGVPVYTYESGGVWEFVMPDADVIIWIEVEHKTDVGTSGGGGEEGQTEQPPPEEEKWDETETVEIPDPEGGETTGGDETGEEGITDSGTGDEGTDGGTDEGA